MAQPITRAVTRVRTVSQDLMREGKGRILLTVTMGWFLSMGVRYIYPSLLPFFRESFGFDLTTGGLLLTALWTAYALGQFPGGVLGDRFGEGNVLVLSTATSAVALLLAASSLNVWMLFAGTMGFGVANALYATMRFTIFTDIYDARAGTAVGLTMAGGSVGNTVLPALSAAIASYATWRLGLGFLVPIFAGVTVALWVYVPSRTSDTEPDDGLSVELARRILANIRGNRIPLVVTVHVLLAFASLGFLGFYPTYLVESKGFSPQVAAIIYGLYFAAGTVVQPLTGASSDRFGPRWTLVSLSGLFFAGLFFLRYGQTIPVLVLLTVFLSNRNGVGVVTNTFIADVLPDDIKGSGLGLLRTVWILVGASSPLFVGYLGDLGQLDYAFLVLAGVAGVATVLAVFVPDE